MQKIIFFLFSVCCFVSNGYSQVAGANLTYLSEYKEQLPYFQELITGGQYAEASRLIQGNPYFASRQFENGMLTINGIVYPEVPLLYDSYLDQVVTFHPIFNQKILIKPEKIDGFVLSNGSSFRFISGNEQYLRNENGIYEVLGEGGFLAVAKRYKTTKELRELSQYDAVFLEKSDFFLVQSGVFYPVSKGKQAIEVLGLDPKTAKRQLRSAGLNFKQSPEKYLQFLVTQTAAN
ncbi:hypothetical protein [Algoriphagus litoralis]|uniref:hypothetical protein n=1 Tax=Algoriphagus litoralis TaxID=2202829 RepID=UPI000DBA1A88|nr:hypothetical protein [Algoriphagus litoralis]